MKTTHTNKAFDDIKGNRTLFETVKSIIDTEMETSEKAKAENLNKYSIAMLYRVKKHFLEAYHFNMLQANMLEEQAEEVTEDIALQIESFRKKAYKFERYADYVNTVDKDEFSQTAIVRFLEYVNNDDFLTRTFSKYSQDELYTIHYEHTLIASILFKACRNTIISMFWYNVSKRAELEKESFFDSTSLANIRMDIMRACETETEKKIVLYKLQDLTQKQIANRLNMTQKQVSRKLQAIAKRYYNK